MNDLEKNRILIETTKENIIIAVLGLLLLIFFILFWVYFCKYRSSKKVQGSKTEVKDLDLHPSKMAKSDGKPQANSSKHVGTVVKAENTRRSKKFVSIVSLRRRVNNAQRKNSSSSSDSDGGEQNSSKRGLTDGKRQKPANKFGFWSKIVEEEAEQEEIDKKKRSIQRSKTHKSSIIGSRI